jgi:lipopolysaccharide cholinephosphotransferase
MQNNNNCNIKPQGQLRALQLVLLDMLLEVDRVCKKNNISYSLIGGTLLGAVRHGGFIPWDDDVDVMMLGNEYLRFKEAVKTDLDESKYFFQDNTTDPFYPWGYARIRRKNSEFIREGQEHLKMQTGIFLDIFPRDNVPDNKLLRPLHKFVCFCIRKTLYAQTGKNTGKYWFTRLLYSVLAKIPVKFAHKCKEKLAARCNKKQTELVRTYTFPTPKGKYGYYKKYYAQLANISFEGHMLPGVENYNAYLTYKYGNYMALPPPEKRHWHAAVKIVLPKD